MRKDYLNLTQSQEFLNANYGLGVSIDALRKHINRGVLESKQYTSRGPHLLTRTELNRWAKERSASSAPIL